MFLQVWFKLISLVTCLFWSRLVSSGQFFLGSSFLVLSPLSFLISSRLVSSVPVSCRLFLTRLIWPVSSRLVLSFLSFISSFLASYVSYCLDSSCPILFCLVSSDFSRQSYLDSSRLLSSCLMCLVSSLLFCLILSCLVFIHLILPCLSGLVPSGLVFVSMCVYLGFNNAAVEAVVLLLVQQTELQRSQRGCQKRNTG